ncbi:MAG: nitrous oxide-stimulated promoter family protein [Candidatus Thorarchaeota archaeon]
MAGFKEPNSGPKILKEKEVVERMIRLYCQKKHGTNQGNLCDDCRKLNAYSEIRLDHCRYGEEKPSCRKCKTHCYSPSNKATIKSIMRFSGPRLVLRAPADWIRHFLQER